MILISFLVVASCSKEEPASTEINGKFIAETGCEIEVCTEYIEFVGNTQADLSFGDIIARVDYKVTGKTIDLQFDKGKNLSVSFTIQDERTLIDTKYNLTWKKL